MSDTRLAIVGTRLVNDPDAARVLILEALRKHEPYVIISGGATGIDSMAAHAARVNDIDLTVFKPDGHEWVDFKRRNMDVAESCDVLVCIRDRASKSYGSGWTADYAQRIGKQVYRYEI